VSYECLPNIISFGTSLLLQTEWPQTSVPFLGRHGREIDNWLFVVTSKRRKRFSRRHKFVVTLVVSLPWNHGGSRSVKVFVVTRRVSPFQPFINLRLTILPSIFFFVTPRQGLQYNSSPSEPSDSHTSPHPRLSEQNLGSRRPNE